MPLWLVKSPPDYEGECESRLVFVHCIVKRRLIGLTLAHEVGNDTVEARSLEAESLLASAQGTEVLSGLGDHVGAQL